MNALAIIFFVLTILVTLGVTFWAARRSQGKADYYAAGGRITGFQNGLAISGDFLSATAFLGLTGMYYASGLDQAAIYFLTPLVGLNLMLLLVAAPLRRAGKFTIGDVLTSRLNHPGIRLFAGCSTIVISVIYLVGQLVGAGLLIAALFGLTFHVSVILVGILMTVYVAGGGMLAATWVQIIKAFLLIGLVIFLAVVCVLKGGGLPQIYAAAGGAHPFGLQMFRPGGSHTDLFSSLSLAWGLTIGMLGLPHLLIRFFTVPDARAAQKSAVVATTIIGGVFLLLSGVIGPSTVAMLAKAPAFHDAHGALKGGPNLAAIDLAGALGGPVLMGVTSAIGFATILAVVSGLVMATASAASHDVYKTLIGKRVRGDREEMTVFRISAAIMAAISVGMAFLFEHNNVAFLTALAFAVAASANVPVLLLTLYWKPFNVAGALSGGLVGLIGSVSLIVMGPAVWVKILGHAHAIFPSDYPALLVSPIALITGVVVSLLTRPKDAVSLRMESVQVRS